MSRRGTGALPIVQRKRVVKGGAGGSARAESLRRPIKLPTAATSSMSSQGDTKRITSSPLRVNQLILNGKDG
jgi:hypothetical protein